MILVSSCLAGIECRYDGKSKGRQDIITLVETGQAIAVCPEELGGLPTPRPASEQREDKIININGLDCTKAFHKGAQKALRIALDHGVHHAILKSSSPMCGVGRIYDGSFKGSLTPGDGVFTKYLKENKIKVEERD